MRYALSLRIGSTYACPVATGRHVLRIAPLDMPDRQQVEALGISIDPDPASRRDFLGFFGNPAIGIAIRHPHQRLAVTLSARVTVTAPRWNRDGSTGLPQLVQEMEAIRAVDATAPHHFVAPSPRLLTATAELSAYAGKSLAAGPSVFAVAQDMMERIHRDFTYDAKATTVDTRAADAFRLRRGVCQDFAHVMILALRTLGIPAAYVSGYLRTLPPKGRPRLVGADAMHAWARVWCGAAAGWIEFDPTNRMLAGEDHIVAGFGRDYSDIAPLSGTVKIHGDQQSFQQVDIIDIG
nr:transglutaminase family protein [uncultured Gellertiella sp.]